MNSLAPLGPPLSSPYQPLFNSKFSRRNPRIHLKCSPSTSQSIDSGSGAVRSEYKPGVFDDLFLSVFRSKMAEEVGWDSEKPGYDGLIEVANHLMMKNRTNAEISEAAGSFHSIKGFFSSLKLRDFSESIFLFTQHKVRILRSLFPPFLLELYKMLISPLGRGKVAALMVARVTALSCQWLMGPCGVNSVDLPDGSTWRSGVLVEKCKYLEESKCVGICVNTCKLPTQTFFKECMGVPLVMEPNFIDYSCQFKFGVLPPANDETLNQPCLEICPNATRRRELRSGNAAVLQCPKV